jgi:hypothetical protein
MTTKPEPKLESFLVSQEIPDPFDPAVLRIKPDFIETAGVKKLLTTVPERKPNKQDFIRVRDATDFRDTFALIQIGEDREFYLVPPPLAPELVGEYNLFTVYTAINRQGTVFLWPVRLPGADGKTTEWWKSAHQAAAEGTKSWVRVTANQNLGAYEIRVATNIITAPDWPDVTFRELLRIAFTDHLIDSVEHPVVKQLRGLA